MCLGTKTFGELLLCRKLTRICPQRGTLFEPLVWDIFGLERLCRFWPNTQSRYLAGRFANREAELRALGLYPTPADNGKAFTSSSQDMSSDHITWSVSKCSSIASKGSNSDLSLCAMP